MTNFTENEIQILDTLGTCTEILAAIQYLTDSLFVEDGELNRDSDAYKFWRDPSYDDCLVASERVMNLAWEFADDDTEHLHWGEYTERR